MKQQKPATANGGEIEAKPDAAAPKDDAWITKAVRFISFGIIAPVSTSAQQSEAIPIYMKSGKNVEIEEEPISTEAATAGRGDGTARLRLTGKKKLPRGPSEYHQGGTSSEKKKRATTLVDWESKINSLTNFGSASTFPIMFTAPENMRSIDEDDRIFDPVLVSIGPFHHHRPKFKGMEDHKERVLVAMLHRHNQKNPGSYPRGLLTELVDAMENLEDYARGLYSKSFPGIDFPIMMICDGCFILEIFRMHAGKYTEDGDDPIFFGRWMLHVLALDIVKLENQLPYFVLTKLPEEPPLSDLAGRFLSLLCPGLDTLEIEDIRSHDHLLAIFHSTFIRNEYSHSISIHGGNRTQPARRLNGNVNCNSFPSVTDLRLSGIKVVKKEQSTRWNLLDIEYRNHKLKLPTLVVDHSTQVLMRNLVAYEQCNKTVPSIFMSYVTFIDALVNSAEDVEALRVAGVISHFMNSNEEVSRLLNNLTANIKYDMNGGCLSEVNFRVYSDYRAAYPRPGSRYRRLVSSRQGIVYAVTIFALYLTVLQTVFTLLSYFYPKV